MAFPIKKIKKEYDSYQSELLSKKRFLRETGFGYYGSAPVEPVFMFFEKIKLKGKFLDLGSGDGKVVMIASLFEGVEANGIEGDTKLVKDSKKIAKKLGIKTNFILGDYLDADVSGYDYLFLNPDGPFPELEKKLRGEMKKDAKLIVFGKLYNPLNMELEKRFDVDGFLFGIYINK